jgi:PAS domain-containing protein
MGIPVGQRLGVVLVGLSVYFSGDHTGGAVENELLFLWPILYAGYFFSRRGMAIQLGLVGLVYGAALAALDVGDQGIARWIGAMGTLVAAAVFVKYLKERNDRNRSLHEATIESTTDGILVVDGDGVWEVFNRKFIEMWRIPRNRPRRMTTPRSTSCWTNSGSPVRIGDP